MPATPGTRLFIVGLYSLLLIAALVANAVQGRRGSRSGRAAAPDHPEIVDLTDAALSGLPHQRPQSQEVSEETVRPGR